MTLLIATFVYGVVLLLSVGFARLRVEREGRMLLEDIHRFSERHAKDTP